MKVISRTCQPGSSDCDSLTAGLLHCDCSEKMYDQSSRRLASSPVSDFVQSHVDEVEVNE